MDEHCFQFKYKTLLLSELNEQDKALILSAMKSREQAYAPYSSLWVGAAVVLCASTQGNILEIGSIKDLLPFCFELLY